MTKTAPPRIVGLDYLRVGLALLIFLFHSRIHLLCDYGFLNNFIREGNLAMTGFFMLSGYVLMMNYSKTDLKNGEIILFYKRRVVSIYPLYIVTGTCFVAIMILGGYQSIADNLILLPIEVFGLQSMFQNSLSAYAHNGGTWFISCLLVCYSFFPVIKIVLLNLSRYYKCLTLMLFLGAYIPLVAKCFEVESMYTNPVYRLLEFSIGCTLACISMQGQMRMTGLLRKALVIFSTIAMVLIVSWLHAYDYPNEWVVLFYFVVILYLLGTDEKYYNESKTLFYLSKMSYAFFLAQFFVWNPMKLLLQYFQIPNIGIILTSLLICTIVSIILHETIEVKLGNVFKKALKM